jgi:hypothetical protein
MKGSPPLPQLGYTALTQRALQARRIQVFGKRVGRLINVIAMATTSSNDSLARFVIWFEEFFIGLKAWLLSVSVIKVCTASFPSEQLSN